MVKIMNLEQKDRSALNHLVDTLIGKAISAYFDSFVYLVSYDQKINKNRESFVFKYSFYAIQERLIIATKKLIEPAKSDKITMFSIGKIIERQDFCKKLEDKKGIKHIYTNRLQKLSESDNAARLKTMRDILCHNICKKDDIGCYCKDFMNVLTECLNILLDVREQILGLYDIDLQKVKDLAFKLAQDYWICVNSGAEKTIVSQEDLQLADSFVGNKSNK